MKKLFICMVLVLSLLSFNTNAGFSGAQINTAEPTTVSWWGWCFAGMHVSLYICYRIENG